jgi:hypothetical protein
MSLSSVAVNVATVAECRLDRFSVGSATAFDSLNHMLNASSSFILNLLLSVIAALTAERLDYRWLIIIID